MRALVTGAHGFIGSQLVEELLDQGYRVRALVSPWGQTGNLAACLAHPELELTRGDITDPQSLEGAFSGVEVVFHAAARVAEWGPWEPFYRANVEGTRNVLAAAEAAGAGRLVLVSSVAVHRYRGFRSADPRALPRDGDVNAYARSKVMAEELVAAAGGLEPVIVRPGLWPFGPRDPNFARQLRALRQGLRPLVDGGQAIINTAYAPNLAMGLRLAAESKLAPGRVYVVADEGAPTWKELMEELARLVGAPRPRFSLPAGVAAAIGNAVERGWAAALPGREPPLSYYMAYVSARDIHFSIEAARSELGYRPRWSWQEGLRRTVEALGESNHAARR